MAKQVVELSFDVILDEHDDPYLVLQSAETLLRRLDHQIDYFDWREIGTINEETGELDYADN
jgi:hypothetical protein